MTRDDKIEPYEIRPEQYAQDSRCAERVAQDAKCKAKTSTAADDSEEMHCTDTEAGHPRMAPTGRPRSPMRAAEKEVQFKHFNRFQTMETEYNKWLFQRFPGYNPDTDETFEQYLTEKPRLLPGECFEPGATSGPPPTAHGLAAKVRAEVDMKWHQGETEAAIYFSTKLYWLAKRSPLKNAVGKFFRLLARHLLPYAETQFDEPMEELSPAIEEWLQTTINAAQKVGGRYVKAERWKKKMEEDDRLRRRQQADLENTTDHNDEYSLMTKK